MKSFFVYFLFACSFITIHAQTHGNKKVRTVTQYDFRVNADGYVETESKRLFMVSKYDSLAQLSEQIIYKGDGNQFSRTTYTYANGKKTEMLKYNDEDILEYKMVIKYDDKAHVLEETYTRANNKPWYKTNYKYDEKGSLTETTETKADGKLNFAWKFKYDEQGHEIAKEDYAADGSLEWKSSFKYDAKGRTTEEASYRADGNIRFKITIKYDAKGNEIEYDYFSDEKTLYFKWNYKYNEFGDEAEGTKYDKTNKPIGFNQFEYEYAE